MGAGRGACGEVEDLHEVSPGDDLVESEEARVADGCGVLDVEVGREPVAWPQHVE